MLYHATAFEQIVLLFVAHVERDVHAALLLGRKVGVEFGQFACSAEHIHAPVIVEEQRCVVKVGQARVLRPSLARVFRCVDK